jgi:dimethylamine/trimethylamine dehydrogenase
VCWIIASGRLQTMSKVDLFLESDLTADDILEFGCQHVVTATGSRWTNEIYTAMEVPVGRIDGPECLHAERSRRRPRAQGPTLVFDFDNYYYGAAWSRNSSPKRATRSPM